jgi:uncharacterized protein (DUF2147 family)
MQHAIALTMARAGALLIALSLSALARVHAAEEAITGTWFTEEGDSKVEIGRSGSTFSGKVVWLKEPERSGQPVSDANNTNAALRNRPIMGSRSCPGSNTGRATCGRAAPCTRRAGAVAIRPK